MKETVALLDSLQESIPKVQYWSLKGRALNISTEYCREAEECLSKAVKHDPTLVEAWCSLGESYWKAGNVQQAHDCFTGSLAHVGLCSSRKSHSSTSRGKRVWFLRLSSYYIYSEILCSLSHSNMGSSR